MPGRGKTRGRPKILFNTLSEIGAAFGFTKQYASKLTKKPDFPAKGDNGWRISEVESYIAKQAKKNELPPDLPAGPVSPAVGPEDDPLTVTRKAMRYAQDQFDLSKTMGVGTSKALSDLQNALEELRKAEAAYLELKQKSGELIPLDAAIATACQVVARMIQALDNFTSSLPNQVEEWLSDKFRALPVEERQREVRIWSRAKATAVREASVEEVTKMLADEVGDRK